MTYPPAATGRARARSLAAGGVVGLALVVSLVGCSSAGTSPASPSPTPTHALSSGASPSATATDRSTPAPGSAFLPGGTAEQNRAFFDQVNRATLAANAAAKGRDFIDGLVAAGFPKAQMQVTPDQTSIGLEPGSIQFSVRLGDACLIGQNGADAGGYSSMVGPVLSTGRCLIGQTRPIDW